MAHNFCLNGLHLTQYKTCQCILFNFVNTVFYSIISFSNLVNSRDGLYMNYFGIYGSSFDRTNTSPRWRYGFTID